MTILDKLKQYQDIIGIVLFFLGGFFWIQTQFPQKSDLESVKQELQKENGILRCLLKKNMVLVQDQIQASALEKNIKEKNEFADILARQLDKMSSGTEGVSPAMQSRLDETREEIANKKEELKAVILRMQTTKNELEINSCGESA
jgi:hypothetical protein